MMLQDVYLVHYSLYTHSACLLMIYNTYLYDFVCITFYHYRCTVMHNISPSVTREPEHFTKDPG